MGDEDKTKRQLMDELAQMRQQVAELTMLDADHRRVQEGLQQSCAELQRTLQGTVNALISATEMRDPYTAGHQRRGRIRAPAAVLSREL